MCDLQKAPSLDDWKDATSSLVYASDPNTSVHETLRSYLAEDLQELIKREVETIKGFTPMQISDRYLPVGSAQVPSRSLTQDTELLLVAQQIAHISVLHWRVWAPILYEQPYKSGD